MDNNKDLNSLDEIRCRFSHDTFASSIGCKIISANTNLCECELDITPKLLNEQGTIMGGAIFTLADYALGVTSNLDHSHSVSVDCFIRYIDMAKGSKLRAVCKLDKNKNSLKFYTITISDNTNSLIAIVNATTKKIKGKTSQ